MIPVWQSLLEFVTSGNWLYWGENIDFCDPHESSLVGEFRTCSLTCTIQSDPIQVDFLALIHTDANFQAVSNNINNWK